MTAMLMAHDTDPKRELLDKLGDLGGVNIYNNQVLVAVYVRPAKTRGGIILSDQTRDEDQHQGKVGLIVKLGDTALKPDGEWSWPGLQDDPLGQWIFFRASDGWGIKINGVMCRILTDTAVRGRLDSPDQVW